MMDEEARLAEQFGRKRPFDVPQGYFDQLSERMMAQTSRKQKALTMSLWSRMRMKIVVAASVCVLVGLGYGVLRHVAPSEEYTQMAVQKPIQMPHEAIEQTADADIAKVVEIVAEPMSAKPKTPRQIVKSEKARRVQKSKPLNNKIDVLQPDMLDETIDYLMMDTEELYAMLDEE